MRNFITGTTLYNPKENEYNMGGVHVDVNKCILPVYTIYPLPHTRRQKNNLQMLDISQRYIVFISVIACLGAPPLDIDLVKYQSCL